MTGGGEHIAAPLAQLAPVRGDNRLHAPARRHNTGEPADNGLCTTSPHQLG